MFRKYEVVPGADVTTNSYERDVVGNKTDVAVSVVAATKSVIGYLKGIIALLQMLGRQKGSVWFADSTISASGAGQSWATAFKTITEAVAAAAAGDTIMCRGSFSEAVTANTAGLRIIGAGTVPKECQWTGANDTKCLTLSANYIEVANIYFVPPAYTADRGATAISLSGANHAFIHHCRFHGKTGSQAAIYSAVCDSDNVTVDDNEFYYLNTATYGAGILGVEAGGLSYSGWKIRRNIFNSCVTAININGRVCTVRDNVIMEYGIRADATLNTVLALGIDLSGTSSGGNAVVGNQLGGTYDATLYKVGASGDQWAGNYNVLSGGLTAANPTS